MANMINLNLDNNVISFNFGSFNLDYHASDKKDIELQEKAEELTKEAQTFEELGDDMTEKEARETLKGLIDDFFKVMFDSEAPSKIYAAVGENSWSYLDVFLQISKAIQQEKQKKLNDENFKKYLAE